jgi:gamma-glutamylcyclotransferase
MALPIVGSAHEKPSGAGFTWFIYGSSLSKAAFETWAERHQYPLPDFSRAIPARLSGYRLSFDIPSGFWEGAVASLLPAPDHAVEGIALPLPGMSRVLVDHKEGALSGLYEPFSVTVTPLSGGEGIEALAYRSNPERRLAGESAVSPAFLEALREGAKEWGLSATYQEELSRIR